MKIEDNEPFVFQNAVVLLMQVVAEFDVMFKPPEGGPAESDVVRSVIAPHAFQLTDSDHTIRRRAPVDAFAFEEWKCSPPPCEVATRVSDTW